MSAPSNPSDHAVEPTAAAEIARLRVLWNEVSPARKASGATFKRMEDEHWLVWKNGLSPKLRLHLILHCFRLGGPEFARKAKLHGTLERCLSPVQKRHYPNAVHQAGIVATLDGTSLTGKPWTAAEVFEREFWGPDAVDGFVAFVTGREVGQELLPQGTPDLLLGEGDRAGQNPRADAVERIKAFLRSEDRNPILVVHQQGMRTGLTSLAAHLTKLVRSDPALRGRRLFYLPLTGPGPRVTMPLLATRIHDFYRGRAAVDTTPPTGARALQQIIFQIRERMSRDPAILVFDGYRSQGKSLPHLRAAMVDDPLLPLLEQLVHPYLGHATDIPAATAFLRNRIVVLSDRAVESLAEFAAEPVPFPYPGPEMLAAMVSAGPEGPANELVTALRARPLCKSDVAIGLSRLLLEKGVAEPDLPDSPDGLFRLYVDRLTSERPLCSTLLHLVALSDDGLRRETLAVLLDGLSSCLSDQSVPSSPWPASRGVTEGQCDEALQLLVGDGVLMAITDDRTPGVDRAGPDATPSTLYDTVSNELRNHLQLRLATLAHARYLCLAHRLIAEEALRQYTRRLRQPDWLDRFDPRYFRRLWQFFFHAYLSLGGGPSGEVAGIGAVPHVLPARNEEAYRRLYAVFFRELLEGPPTWELSRVLGRDGLKADILLLALGSGDEVCQLAVLRRDRPWSVGRAGPFIRPGDWQRSRTGPGELREMGRDMRWSLARALFQLQRLSEVRPLLAEIEATVGSADGAAVRTRWFARTTKLRLDMDLTEKGDTTGYSDIRDDAVRELKRPDIDFPDGDLDEIRRLARSIRSGGRTSGAELLTARGDELVSLWSAGKDAATLAAWSDLLCRYAEAGAFQAESTRATLDAAPSFLDSFVAYLVAEKLRRAAFDADPLGRAYVVNSRSTRILVRVALQLVKAHHEDAAAALRPGGALALGGYPSTEFLMRQAQRHIDIATRYFAGLPSELPNLLIMQSQFERAPRRDRVRELRAALTLLDEADSMMWAARDRRRLRMRLLLERCKVLRGLADAGGFGSNDSPSLLALAEQDALRLKDLSERLDVPIWRHLAEAASAKVLASALRVKPASRSPGASGTLRPAT